MVEPAPVVVEPVVVAPVEPVAAPVVEAPVSKIEAPEIEAPKVINKIDLSAIDSSTRPKKTTKKTEAPAPVAPTPAPAPAAVVEPVAAPVVEAPVAKPVVPEVPEVEAGPVIENIRAEKLEGPKILGKIELPINSDTRPKPMGRDEKRKRKRIPIDKKPDAPATGTPGAPGAPARATGPNRPIVPANNNGGFNRGGGGVANKAAADLTVVQVVAEIAAVVVQTETEAQLHVEEMTTKRLTKKQYRKKSVKHRPNYLVLVDAERA